MLRYIVEREINDCIYSYRSLVLFVLLTALFGLAVYTGAREYQTEVSEYRLAQTAMRQNLQEETTLYALSTAGFSFVKPPLPLSILVNGLEHYTPRAYTLSMYYLPEPQGSKAAENPTSAVFGSLDVSFVVEVVLGLAALLFTFSSVCGEKETGTLKLQLANPLPRDKLLLGKLLGNLLGLLVPAGLSFLLACVLLTAFQDVSLSYEDVVRMLLLGLVFMLYVLVLFAAGIFISTLTTRSTTAFALSIGLWVILVAIIPRLATIAAGRLAPTPPFHEYEMKKTALNRHISVELQELMAQWVRQHPKQTLSRDIYEDLLRQVRKHLDRELTVLEEDYQNRRVRQVGLAVLLSRLSPAGSVADAAMGLGRIGSDRDFQFRQALTQYRSQFSAYYDRKTVEELSNGEMTPLPRKYPDVPGFAFAEEPFSVSMNRVLPDVAMLAVWALVFFAASYVTFLRYDVR